jgi:hypothetical protein
MSTRKRRKRERENILKINGSKMSDPITKSRLKLQIT